MKLCEFICSITCRDVYCLLAVAIGIGGVLFGFFRLLFQRKFHVFTPLTIMFICTFLSAFMLFIGLKIPMEKVESAKETTETTAAAEETAAAQEAVTEEIDTANKRTEDILAVFYAFHGSIRLFVVDYSLNDLLPQVESVLSKEAMGSGHSSFLLYYICTLVIFAPILTFTAVLAFFKDYLSHIRLLLHFLKDRYVFSELNEKSIVLAESIYRKKYFKIIVFAGVTSEKEGQDDDLIYRAKMIHAIRFKKDITSINFHKSILGLPVLGRLTFFAINQTGTENVRVATGIRKAYGNRKYTRLYIFSPSIEAAIFAKSTENENIEIRRIDEARSVVYNKLYDMEVQRYKKGSDDLFISAAMNGEEKTISAVIVGMGQYGTEMLKVLTWFCQMDHYKVKINAFDIGASAKNRIKANCPELLDEEHNGQHITGDAYYEISVHPETDVESEEFTKKIDEIPDITYVFVALGSDEANIEASVYLRRMFARKNLKPMIHTVVYNSDKARILAMEKQNIECIGDVKTMYSYDVIFNSTLEAQAMKIHQRWKSATEKNFYGNEYNYRSSMASALHLNAMIACRLRGEGIQENIDELSELEHKRWNAYMRTEGYVYGGNRSAKQHNNLIPYDKLDENEKEKDKRIIELSVLDVSQKEPELPGFLCRIRDWLKRLVNRNEES